MSKKLVAQALAHPDLLTDEEIRQLGSYAMKMEAASSEKYLERANIRNIALAVLAGIAILGFFITRGCETHYASSDKEVVQSYETACRNFGEGESPTHVVHNMCAGFNLNVDKRIKADRKKPVLDFRKAAEELIK
jgi:hypothetical protein